MDGTLVDSIGAVEQAWGSVADGEYAHSRLHTSFLIMAAVCQNSAWIARP